MNYVYKNAIISYACSHITGKEFANEIMTIAENYPPMCVNSLMNCLSTHDTARIINSLSFCEFPNSKKEMSQKRLTETEYRDAVERLFLAIFLQYTLPGMPCIYYGDEIGMQGFGDPFCRGYFSWDKTDDGILSFYKALGKIKNKYVSLKKGDIEFISNGDVLIFKRRFQNEEFTAIINMGDESFVTENKDIVISHMVSYADEKIYINKGGFAGIIQKRM